MIGLNGRIMVNDLWHEHRGSLVGDIVLQTTR